MKNSKTTRVGAYGLITRDSQIVLCRLSSNVATHPGKWTLPGGELNFGEDPADAVVREVREETGLSVKVSSLAEIDSLRLNLDQGDYHSIRVIYLVSLLGGNLRNEVGGSTDRCEWYSYEQAAKLPLVDLVQVGLKLAFPNS